MCVLEAVLQTYALIAAFAIEAIADRELLSTAGHWTALHLSLHLLLATTCAMPFPHHICVFSGNQSDTLLTQGADKHTVVLP